MTQRRSWLVALVFGLLHGLAFAGLLAEIGLPPEAELPALLMFNAGVEIGQLLFIGALLAVVSVTSHLTEGTVYKSRWAALAPAYFIGTLSSYWLIERILAAI